MKFHGQGYVFFENIEEIVIFWIFHYFQKKNYPAVQNTTVDFLLLTSDLYHNHLSTQVGRRAMKPWRHFWRSDLTRAPRPKRGVRWERFLVGWAGKLIWIMLQTLYHERMKYDKSGFCCVDDGNGTPAAHRQADLEHSFQRVDWLTKNQLNYYRINRTANMTQKYLFSTMSIFRIDLKI